jgi:glycosyltransferase involved in cell wall biosynthesis
MKILILMRSCTFTARGGAEVQVNFIKDAFFRAGHEVHFAYDEKVSVEIDDPQATYHSLPDRGKLASWRNYGAIKKLVAEIKPDIIYQRVRQGYTALGAVIAKQNGIPFVHHISADYACKKNRVAFDQNFLSGLVSEYLGRYGIAHADLLIAQTKIQANMLKANFGLESLVIPNGHPAPSRQGVKANPPVVLWVANIKAWKQPKIFIDLAKRLSDTEAKFVMIGKEGDKKFHHKFLEMTLAVQNLEYVGQLSLEEVNVWLARSSIFVNTSLPREGFPNTFIQAWLRSVPVVSLNFDPDDINTAQDIGFLSKTSDNLERDVRVLLSSEQMRLEMGARARLFSLANFHTPVTDAVYLREFRRLVNASQKL